MPVSCVAPLRRECVHHSLREPHPSVTFLIGLPWWIGWWRQVIVGGWAGSYPLSLQDLVRDGSLEIISDHEYISQDSRFINKSTELTRCLDRVGCHTHPCSISSQSRIVQGSRNSRADLLEAVLGANRLSAVQTGATCLW